MQGTKVVLGWVGVGYQGKAKLTGLDGIEEVGPLSGLLDVCINQERVCLRVDVLHHDLETVEAPSFGDLNLAAESLEQVLVDNAIRRGEEGEDVGDEEALVISQAVVPVVEILGQVDLLGSPEGSLVLLVHLPDLFRNVLEELSRTTLRVCGAKNASRTS